MGFPRQEKNWMGLILLQEIFPAQGQNHISCLIGRFFTTEPSGKPMNTSVKTFKKLFFFFNYLCVCVCAHVHTRTRSWMLAKSLQSYLTLCDPMPCSPPGSSGILQARILEGVAMPPSRGSYFYFFLANNIWLNYFFYQFYSIFYFLNWNKVDLYSFFI